MTYFQFKERLIASMDAQKISDSEEQTLDAWTMWLENMLTELDDEEAED